MGPQQRVRMTNARRGTIPSAPPPAPPFESAAGMAPGRLRCALTCLQNSHETRPTGGAINRSARTRIHRHRATLSAGASARIHVTLTGDTAGSWAGSSWPAQTPGSVLCRLPDRTARRRLPPRLPSVAPWKCAMSRISRPRLIAFDSAYAAIRMIHEALGASMRRALNSRARYVDAVSGVVSGAVPPGPRLRRHLHGSGG